MEPSDNPYSILGISEDATAREIRTAYRRKALEYHPDRNPDDPTIFAKINHAYEVLSQTNDRPKQTPRPADPFSVFESVFRDEFDRDFFQQRDTVFPQDPFASPFFRKNTVFEEDPFFRGGLGRMDEMFGRMDQVFGRMDSAFGNNNNNNNKPNNNNHMQYYSSSSISRRDSNGRWVTETKTNQNGEISTEYITRDTNGNILEQRRSIQEPEPTKKGFFRLPWRREDWM